MSQAPTRPPFPIREAVSRVTMRRTSAAHHGIQREQRLVRKENNVSNKLKIRV